MITAVGLTIFKIDSGQSQTSQRNRLQLDLGKRILLKLDMY